MNHTVRFYSLVLIAFLLANNFLLVSCGNGSNTERLEKSLSLSGQNKEELIYVLDYYSKNPADSLKYHAARFLIENMLYHHSIDFPQSQDYYERTDSVFRIDNITPGYTNLVKAKLAKIERDVDWQHLEIKPDLKNVTSSFLITHIENAFKLKDFPWYTQLAFDDFCEYILPYRLMNEPLENWIPIYQNTLSMEIDSLLTAHVTDSAICSFFINHFFQPYEYKSYVYNTDFYPSSYLNMKIGSCKELTAFAIYVLRSLGIAVTWDFTPQWGNRSRGHDWNSLLRQDKPIPFAFGDKVAFGNHLIEKAKNGFPKVYRKTFSAQSQTLPMKYPNEEIPPFFADPCMKDVSELYFEGTDIKIDLVTPKPAGKEIAYICVFDNKQWVPVHWGEIRNKQVTFTKMGRDCAYCVMYYHNNFLLPASCPFLLDSIGNVNYLEPDTCKLQTITLKRKYKTYPFLKRRMLGGRFQGANNLNFSDAVDLYTIDEYENDVLPKYITVKNNTPFKYFRYLSPPRSYMYMAEIEIYNDKNQKLSGKVLGTEGSFMNDGNIKEHVFDGNPLTFFNAPEPSGAWVGLEFDKKELLTRFVYMPRNDDNFICVGQLYELFYFDKEWVSLGVELGDKTHVLIYDNVPDGALLLLKNHTKGIEERIFTYENGEQMWW